MKISVVLESTNRIESVELPNDEMSVLDFKEILNALFDINIDNKFFFYVAGKAYRYEKIAERNGLVKGLNLKDGSILVLSVQYTDAPILISLGITEDYMENLIKSIKVKHSSQGELIAYLLSQKEGYKIFKTLRESTNNYYLHQIGNSSPGLSKFYDQRPTDVGRLLENIQKSSYTILCGFLLLYTQFFEEQRQIPRIQLTDAEKIIMENQRQAIDENPEILLNTNMLYLHVKLNGVDIIAFVDTGAQQSLINPACVAKCNIGHLVDKSSIRVFSGIGGTQKSHGRIWKVDMEVGGHDVPVTLNVLESEHEMLLGLDIMLRHRAIIDLAHRTITFAGTAVGTFLTDDESSKLNYEEQQRKQDAMDVDTTPGPSSS